MKYVSKKACDEKGHLKSTSTKTIIIKGEKLYDLLDISTKRPEALIYS